MVQLYGNDEPIGTPVELNESNYWQHNFKDLDLLNNGNRINYSVREVLTPSEYDVSYDCSKGLGTWCEITNTPKKRSLTIRKVWDDEENRDNVRPKSVKVQLYNDIYGDGIQVGDPVELNEENNWTYTYNDLRMYSGPVTNKYKLREVDVPEGYTSKITGNQTDGYTITNSYKPNMTTLKINKVWDDKDDKDGIRPDKVMIQLYKDGEPLGEPVEVNKENDWSYEFEDLYVYENGEKVKYTVEMYQEIDGYTYEITGNEEEGYTITNTHIPNENKNPNTLDNIIKFIIISIISLIMLVIGIIIFKKLRRKEV